MVSLDGELECSSLLVAASGGERRKAPPLDRPITDYQDTSNVLRPQRNIKINDRRTDERYQKNMIDDKEYNERNQISKNDEEKIIEDIDIMKLQNFSSKKKIYILRKNLKKINSKDMSDSMD